MALAGGGAGWVQWGEVTPLHAITPPQAGMQPKRCSPRIPFGVGKGQGSWVTPQGGRSCPTGQQGRGDKD